MNSRELLEDLEQLNTFPFAFQLFSPQNRELYDEYHHEMVRHLHNWLSSSKTLVDHVRRYVNKSYVSGTFSARYAEKVEEVFAASCNVRFVHDLRNLVLHWSLPLLDTEIHSAAGEPPTCLARLRKADLEKWRGWSSLSRGHLGKLPDRVELGGIVRSYQQRVEGFYQWLDEELDRLHEPELTELEQLYERLEEASNRPARVEISPGRSSDEAG